jgi:hypothetical protein
MSCFIYTSKSYIVVIDSSFNLRTMKIKLNLIKLFIIVFIVTGFSVVNAQTTRCTSGNCTNGQGTYTWASGAVYVGDFVNGQRTGQGTYTWASGAVYVGDFVNGRRTGQGTYTSASGTVQSGRWENNTLVETNAQIQAREAQAAAEREQRRQEQEIQDRIFNNCLIDKSQDVDMSVRSVELAVIATCRAIAEDPSWYESFIYNK